MRNEPDILKTDELLVGYRKRPLLPPLDFSVEQGELWAIIGQNGSGKTTLLKTLLGLIPRVGGEIVWREDARVGYVPQRSTIDQNVPARVVDLVGQGLDRDRTFLDPFYLLKHRERVRAAMDETGVSQFASEQFANLSEGQKQRVLMARALASNPNLLVLDEPTSAMDVTAEESTLDLLDQLRESRQLAVLLVSHHLTATARHATHVLLVDKDSGVTKVGPIDEVATSRVCRERYGNLLVDARRGVA